LEEFERKRSEIDQEEEQLARVKSLCIPFLELTDDLPEHFSCSRQMERRIVSNGQE
jgi:hypothetical protein